MIYGLDLFSGIGGISYALKEFVRPITYCEIDDYCKRVLMSRMAGRSLAIAPIWDDVQTLSGEQFKGRCDIIYGGFPCQNISTLGDGKGLDGERSGLFFQILRLSKEIVPKFIFLENVPAITSRGGLSVVTEIAEMGYDCRWCVISASSLGAPHKRERWFLLANANSQSEHGLQSREEEGQPVAELCAEHEKWDIWPKNEPSLLRVDDGLPFRMDRTRALGNSVVPSQTLKAFKTLLYG